MTRTARSLRPKTIRSSDLAAAIARGQAVDAAWNKAFPKGHHWQSESCEIMLLPGLWKRMLNKMELDRNYCSYHESLRRFTANGLSGYILQGWNSEPRENWKYSHAASVAWDGVRRSCYPSLADSLRAWHYAQSDREREFSERELWSRWRVRVVVG